ncbi:NAD(P)-binding protein [Stipitochalara longipes BDJ]|nr:NAD(P)-binding protein [Stipitochalara longipes BDJ]
MAKTTFQSVILAKHPKTNIVPGATFKLTTNPILTADDLQDGQVLLETLYISIDPAMRGWIEEGSASYRPSVEISVEVGAVMVGVVIANVLASKTPTISAGQKVFTFNAGWTELAITDAADVTPINLPNGAKLTDSLGVLGFSGLCAYFGLIKEADIKAGDFVVVSGAAGAIGTAACQIALLKGAKVLGTVGTDDKVSYLEELGCDALNYKDKDFAKKFEQKTDGLIDIFFDNVGGKILDLALSRAKPHARFVLCGATSLYNSGNTAIIENYLDIIFKSIRLQGYFMNEYADQFAVTTKILAQWLAEGKLKRSETIIKGGLAVAEEALAGIFTGTNTGKLLVQVKEEN